MDKKTIKLILILILTTSFVTGFFILNENKTNIKNKETQNNTNQDLLNISIISKDTKNGLFTENIEYPKFNNPKLSLLNTSLESFVKDQVSSFEKISKDNWGLINQSRPKEEQREYPESPFMFILKWDPVQINDKYISFIINLNYYVGGANESLDFKTFNFDIEKNKILSLSDLFDGDKDYLSKVSDYSKQDLIKQLNPGSDKNLLDMINDGVKPVGENFENFTFDKYAINIHFKKYQVAPGVYGEQEVRYFFKYIGNNKISNPASKNCEDNQGKLVISKRGDGGEFGLCYFDDARACEEWAMLRGDCPVGGRKTTGYDNDAQKYCAWLGGSTIAEENAKCKFKDGSVCSDEDLYNGKCSKGDSLK